MQRYTHLRHAAFHSLSSDVIEQQHSPLGDFGTLQEDEQMFRMGSILQPSMGRVKIDPFFSDGTYIWSREGGWRRDDAQDLETFSENGYIARVRGLYVEKLGDSWKETFCPYAPDKRWPQYLAENRESIVVETLCGRGKSKEYICDHHVSRPCLGLFKRTTSSWCTFTTCEPDSPIVLGARVLSYSKTWWGKTVVAEY